MLSAAGRACRQTRHVCRRRPPRAPRTSAPARRARERGLRLPPAHGWRPWRRRICGLCCARGRANIVHESAAPRTKFNKFRNAICAPSFCAPCCAHTSQARAPVAAACVPRSCRRFRAVSLLAQFRARRARRRVETRPALPATSSCASAWRLRVHTRLAPARRPPLFRRPRRRLCQTQCVRRFPPLCRTAARAAAKLPPVCRGQLATLCSPFAQTSSTWWTCPTRRWTTRCPAAKWSTA